MEILTLTEGPFTTHTYVAIDSGRAFVVDPGFAGEAAGEALAERGAQLDAVLVTHGHVDHVLSAADLAGRAGAALYFPSKDLFLATGRFQGLTYTVPADFTDLRGGERIQLPGGEARVLFTPGHSPGEVSFVLGERVFTGDTLMRGTIGRPDFPGGDLDTLLESIRREILTLPDATEVLPGHGPRTTVGEERRTNPFLALG